MILEGKNAVRRSGVTPAVRAGSSLAGSPLARPPGDIVGKHMKATGKEKLWH